MQVVASKWYQQYTWTERGCNFKRGLDQQFFVRDQRRTLFMPLQGCRSVVQYYGAHAQSQSSYMVDCHFFCRSAHTGC